MIHPFSDKKLPAARWLLLSSLWIEIGFVLPCFLESRFRFRVEDEEEEDILIFILLFS
jgi:hypothetical protein